jgi:biotin carboxylase
MNIVYLSPHFPPNYRIFSVRLRELGANVLGLADEPYEFLHPELRSALVEYYRVSSLNDYGELVRALGYFTHRYGKIDRIDSLNEYWLETEAALRTDFNIEGPKLNDVVKIKRKSEMKKIFRQAGVAVAPGSIVRSYEDTLEFIGRYGYPVVAKPDIGVGAAKTYHIENEESLQFFLEDCYPIDYFMEKFIEGTIETFDGLTDKSGNIVFFTSHKYSQGIMETVNADDDIYYYSLREIPHDLEEAGRATVEAFAIKERFFHFEYFRTPENKIVALEVNMRPPGGLTTDMFNYANDIDIYREWANILINDRFDAEYNRPYHCCYVGRKSNKIYSHSHSEILNHCGDKIAHHEPISGVFSTALGNYGYLVTTSDLQEAIQIAEFIQRKQ